jgi:thiol:disulfide interchange protein DsbC
MRRLRDFSLALASLTLATSALAASPEETIRETLEKTVPGIQISHIEPAPIKGLYEVMVGTDVMYVTGDGRYFINGHVVDLKTREDLTEPRLAETRQHLIDQIGESQMVIFDTPNAKHTITVFTDIECGYCRKLHSQIAEYGKEGIRVRYLFFPRAGKGSPAYDEAVSVWCAGDEAARRTAMTDAKAGKKIAAKTCANPIDAHMALAADLGLRGTPGIVTEKGELIPGYVEPKRLAAELNGGAGS